MAQEGDFSSQRDKVYLIQIQFLKRQKARLLFSDDSSYKVLTNVITLYNLYKGKEVSFSLIEEINFSSLALEAEAKALELLSRAMHSTHSLKLKLLKRKFPPPVIDQTIARMQELSYLNDEEYAKTWILSRIQTHPEGKNALKSGLLKKGIQNNLAEKVISQLVSPEDEKDMASELVVKLKKMNRTPEKITKTLLSRAFDWEIVRGIINEEFKGS